MNKSTIRKQALEQRNSLTEEQWLALNQKLLDQFKTLDFSKVKTLHIFLPILKKREPNTFLFIDWLAQEHPKIEIIVPKADFAANIISNYRYIDKDNLILNSYQIPEPQNAELFVGTPDMVIVPLLAFDQNGYRVGYGKGFYDRLLQKMKTQKIGLSFFNALPQIIDVHLNDLKLDRCITPNQIINFNY